MSQRIYERPGIVRHEMGFMNKFGRQQTTRPLSHNVGAYNVTQWMQFIMLRPAVVMIGSEGQAACIRRAESTDDLSSLEQVPAWLS